MGGHEVLPGGQTLDAAAAGAALVKRLIALGSLKEDGAGGLVSVRLISVRGVPLFGMPKDCTLQEAGARIINALVNTRMVRKIAVPAETQAPAPQEAETAESDVEPRPAPQETKAPAGDVDAPSTETAEAHAAPAAKQRPKAKPKAKAEAKVRGRK